MLVLSLSVRGLERSFHRYLSYNLFFVYYNGGQRYEFFFAYLPFLESLIYKMHGQAHYVVKRTLDFFYGYIANPLLDAVGSGLVVGVVRTQVVVNLLLAKRCKPNACSSYK